MKTNATLMILVLALTAKGDTVYTVQEIDGIGASSGSNAQALAANGHVAGFMLCPDTNFCGFRWDGNLDPFPAPVTVQDGTPFDANAINSSDVVAGVYFDPNTNQSKAFKFDGNTYTTYNPLGGLTFPYGIDEAGNVFMTSSGHDGIWNDGDGFTEIVVGMGQGGMSTNGYATGGIAASQVPYRYILGVLSPIPNLPGYELGIGHAISTIGWVTGTGTHDNFNSMAFLSTGPGHIQALGTLGGTYSGGAGINTSGTIVGNSSDASGQPLAFIYSNGVMKDLNTLLAAPLSFTLISARAINDNGQILVSGQNGASHKDFLLTPTPEPATTVLFLTGFAILCGWGRRRFTSQSSESSAVQDPARRARG